MCIRDSQETPLHASEAVAPPWLDNQEFSAPMLPLPLHCTVALEAVVITGAVVSTMVKEAVVEEAFPQASLAVNVTVALPVAPHRLESEVKSLLQVTPEHI